jgi:citrate lyase beta subunit
MVRIPSQRSIASLKSWLFTPATKSDRFSRAATVHADALIIDLEDAVAPSSKKEARTAALRYLAAIPADHLPCALSIIACHSTAAKGKVSRIVARLDGPVTTPRMDTHIVVTEFGWTDLKGKSSTERAKALIALAHPEFQAGLTAGAKERHLL